ncbi:MAG TPA: cytochrome c oxidase subunit 2A [Chitinophagaceae bacterium]|nr:cytochrome c oxidase subunit 2A [Chitinophagaceae bacterium]
MESPQEKEKFFPSGAIAFFVVLVILTLVFWYGIYYLMIQRS